MQLRPIEPSEIELVVGWLTDDRNAPWIDFTRGGRTIDAVALRIMTQRDTHVIRIFTSDDGNEPVGVTGLSDMHPAFRTANIWAVLGHKQVGRSGYTVRAVAELLRMGFSELGLSAIQAWTVDCNRGALRIIERLQFRYVGRLRRCHCINGHAHDRLLYDMLAEEYEVMQAVGGVP